MAFLLFDPAEVNNVANLIAVLLTSQIEANPFQSRQGFDPTALLELSQSMKGLGLTQPIKV